MLARDVVVGKIMVAGSNAYPSDLIRGLVREILDEEDAILSAQMTYLATAKRHRGIIADVKKRGKAQGVPPKELNAVLKRINLETRLHKLREEMEDEDQNTYDALCAACGDYITTPLGQAAADAVRPRGAALDSLTS